MADLTPEALAAELAQARQAHDTWAAQLTAGQQELMAQLAMDMEAITALTAERDALNARLDDAGAQVSAALKTVARWQDENQRLIAERAKAQGTRDTFRQRLVDVEAALDDAGYGPGPLDAAVRALAAERDQLKRRRDA